MPAPRSGLRATVLVVDDDPGFRALVRRLLGDAGHAVVVAADGAEALAYLRAGVPADLIVLDLAMPGLSGGEVCATLAADPAWAGVPVALLTGTSPLDYPRAPNVVAWLRKPDDVPLLPALAARHARPAAA